LPSTAGANDRLGQIYEKIGRKYEARLHYQLAFLQDSKMDMAKEG
jgi:hypothetical protein